MCFCVVHQHECKLTGLASKLTILMNLYSKIRNISLHICKLEESAIKLAIVLSINVTCNVTYLLINLQCTDGWDCDLKYWGLFLKMIGRLTWTQLVFFHGHSGIISGVYIAFGYRLGGEKRTKTNVSDIFLSPCEMKKLRNFSHCISMCYFSPIC